MDRIEISCSIVTSPGLGTLCLGHSELDKWYLVILRIALCAASFCCEFGPQSFVCSGVRSARLLSSYFSRNLSSSVYSEDSRDAEVASGWHLSAVATMLLVAFPRQFGAGDGSVQQLHVVHHGQGMSRLIQHCSELQLASRIAGRHRLSRRRDNPLHLALAQLVGRLLLHQTVETCRATAECGFGNLQQFQSGDSSQHGARLFAQSLGVLEVTGLVEGNPQGHRMPRC